MNKPFENLNPVAVTESPEQEVIRLRAENAKLKSDVVKATQKGSSLKITENGGLSCYGLGRFPVTLYLSQWEKLISMVDEIKLFIEANREKLTVKHAKVEQEVA